MTLDIKDRHLGKIASTQLRFGKRYEDPFRDADLVGPEPTRAALLLIETS